MEMTRKQRRLQIAEEQKSHHVKMVKSKSRGWLTIGATTLALLGGVALTQSLSVSAAGPDHPVAVSTKDQSGSTWSLRAESDIQAQIKADSDKSTYEIKWGDTLSTIADSLNEEGITTSVSRLAEINKIANIDLIFAGDTLYINGSGADATVTTKTADGTTTTYNLNPAKPAAATTNTTATSAAASTAKPAATSSQSGSVASTSANATNSTSATAKSPVATNKPATTTVVSKPATTTPATKPDQGGVSVGTDKPATGTTTVPTDNSGQTGATTGQTSTTTPTDNGDQTGTTKPTDNGNQAGTTTEPATKPDDGQTTTQPAATTVTVQAVADGQVIKSQSQAQHAGDVVTAKADATITVNGVQYDLNDSATKTATVAGNDTITFNYTKHVEAQKTGTITTVVKDDQGNVLSTFTFADNFVVGTVIDVAPQEDIAGYDIQDSNSGKRITVVEGSNVVEFLATKHASTPTDTHTPVNTDKQVTVNVDEAGNTLTSTTGYDKVSTSAPVKSVQTAANGDTTTTYTTTVTYKKHVDTATDTHKPVNTDKQVTVNVDEAGNALTSTNGYDKVSASTPVKSVKTAANGDTTTTYTTTVTYKKHVDAHTPTNTDKQVTVNKDEAGNTLTSTTGYTKVSTSAPVKSVATATNGDTTTTYTTTVKWHKVVNTNKSVTVNKDEAGTVLTSTTGYTKVSTSDPVKSVQTLSNGDTTTTMTTTVTWKKTQATKLVTLTIILNEKDGFEIDEITKQVPVDSEQTYTAPELDGYTLVGEKTQTMSISGMNDTMVFDYTKNKVPDNISMSAVAARLTELVNDWRTQNGLSALNVDSDLSAGAAVRAQQEADAVNASGNINDADHYLPDDSQFNYEPHLQQYGSYKMAENLLVTNGSTVEDIAQNAFNQWKNSAGHNANMLGDYFDEGLSVVKLANGQVLALQDFGANPHYKWDASKHNSVDFADAGMTKADVAQDLVNIGEYTSTTVKNVYISNRMFKSLGDIDTWNADMAMADDGTTKSVWAHPDSFACQDLPVYKGTNLIGYVQVEQFNSDAATATAGYSDDWY